MTAAIKYIICFICERFHRYCFDVLYVQDYKRGLYEWICFRLLDLIQVAVPDYRRYPTVYHKRQLKMYDRYTKQWNTGIGGGKSLGQKALRPQPPSFDASVKIQGGGING